MTRRSSKEEDAAYAKEYYASRKDDPEFMERLRGQTNERNRKLRREVISLYGGVCECCGIDDWRFLTLEHKQGGGYVHRKKRGARGVYYDARKTFDPDTFGVLCWNCNSAKGMYGECPHVG